MPRVSVVIPNYNGLEHLPACLDALDAQTMTDAEIVVADNASTDGSLAYLKERGVRVVQLGDNRGFSAAVNGGITATSGDYVVLLNNDTRARPDWLERLVGAMDAAPDFGWGSSKLVRWDAPDTIDSAGHVYSIWVGAARQIGEGEDASTYDTPARIFGAAAAASIYRRSLFDDIGLFDESFFLIHEDTDIDLRANVAGYKCLYIPDAVIEHKRGVSYDVAREIHLMGVRNRIWVTRSLPFGLLVWWVASKGLRALRWLPAKVFGRKTSGRTTASAWRDVSIREVMAETTRAIRTLPGKRREVKTKRRLNSIQLARVFWSTRPSRLEARSQK